MPVFVRVTTNKRVVLNADHIVEFHPHGDGAAVAIYKGRQIATYSVRESVDNLCRQLSADPRNRPLVADLPNSND
jgi:hypothetical protein